MTHNTSVHKQFLSATESPTLIFETQAGDLLTKREQILAELALELILTQNKPDGQKVAKS